MRRLSYRGWRRLMPLLMMLGWALGGRAQTWHPGDVEWPSSQDWATNVAQWQRTHRLGADDNFFISRVKPRKRFTNPATQVNESLVKDVNDKRLCAWLPFNANYDGNKNALPTGEFDSECFTMWSYVDHWGNWSAPLGALPGGFTDVAHKNGVAVSSLCFIPEGPVSSSWRATLEAFASIDTDAAADFLAYYGHDGIGYNSEFSAYSGVSRLATMHENLLSALNERHSLRTPGYDMAEIIWYDGTNINGDVLYDGGLNYHNLDIWGTSGHERSSLFLNYNWNQDGFLERCEDFALQKADRNPLGLYCGINMQGGEPRGISWPYLANANLSIGLWGAHSENMFWQNRAERGGSALTKQQRYQSRLENWFTGGTRNPLTVPEPQSATHCMADDAEFHGMARFMSARSAMGWNLDDEPFVTHFNVGNGRFFNWQGERCNNREWYDIGVQDYMPTWRWWTASRFLGKDRSDASSGIRASFTWDDAYLGGSCLSLEASATEEYLHLLKTQFPLQAGDVITVRYKQTGGSGACALVMSAEGNEAEIAATLPLNLEDDIPDISEWRCRQLTVSDADLAGKTLAMVALQFENADALSILLGEVSVRRGFYPAPTKPDKPTVKVMRNTASGLDAKIIFEVPNDMPEGTVCYNADAGISLFRIWAQEQGEQPILLGATTSWAAMAYSTPFKGDDTGFGRIRYGVQAVGLDMTTLSEIAWSDYVNSGVHTFDNGITVDKPLVRAGEQFVMRATDPKRKYVWTILRDGERAATSIASANKWTCNGLKTPGLYDVKVTASDYEALFPAFLLVSDSDSGSAPAITSMTANGENGASIEVTADTDILLEYTGTPADGTASRALKVADAPVGLRLADVLPDTDGSFSVAGWVKIDSITGNTGFIDIVNPAQKWSINQWGWLYSTIGADGTLHNLSQNFYTPATGTVAATLNHNPGLDSTRIAYPGVWTHFALVVDRENNGLKLNLYINGHLIPSTWEYSRSGYSETTRGTEADFSPAISAPLDPESYLLLGSTRVGVGDAAASSFCGAIDDLSIWSVAMTPEDIAASFSGLDPSALPEGVAAFWDFDGDDPDICPKQYAYSETLTGVEGRRELREMAPQYTAGNPFASRKSLAITTLPSVSAPGLEVDALDGGDTSGSARMSGLQPGRNYNATLTLSNLYGSDSRAVTLVCLPSEPGTGGAEAVWADYDNGGAFTVRIAGSEGLVRISRGGSYRVEVYSAGGILLGSSTCTVADGEILRIRPGKGHEFAIARITPVNDF